MGVVIHDCDDGQHVMRIRASYLISEKYKDKPVEDLFNRDIFQFGVYSGDSIKSIQELWDRRGLPQQWILGFDSFEGLPLETQDEYSHPSWTPGEFNLVKALQVDSVEQAMQKVKEVLPYPYMVSLIPGFWDKSLTDELIQKADIRPASYIDMDCDIYTSCLTALDWVFRNKLYYKGTLIGYHDWTGTPLWLGGESRAHKEMCEKYSIKAEQRWADMTASIWEIV
jgi:hypothetical protein